MEESTMEFAKEASQAEDLKEFLRSMGLDEKGIDAFFLQIVREDELNKQVKVGNLTEEELGSPLLPVRTLIELADDCTDIPSMSSIKESFEKQAQNIVTSSLSRNGFLIEARITQKKGIFNEKKKKVRKGLFGKKEVEN